MSAGGDADEAWTIRRVLTWAADDLKKRGATSPRLDAELLLGRVLRLDRVGLIIDSERPLTRPELVRYRELHQRRRAGEPVAYLLGVREFYARPFVVDRRVLIPRPETEHLVEVALERTRHLCLSARALDLCTGSGCVAVTLGRERPTTRVLGADISPEALAVAAENAIRLGAYNVGLLCSDLFAALHAGRDRFESDHRQPPLHRRGRDPLAPRRYPGLRAADRAHRGPGRARLLPAHRRRRARLPRRRRCARGRDRRRSGRGRARALRRRRLPRDRPHPRLRGARPRRLWPMPLTPPQTRAARRRRRSGRPRSADRRSDRSTRRCCARWRGRARSRRARPRWRRGWRRTARP